MVAEQAVKAGATLWPATRRSRRCVDGGLVTGAVVAQGRRHAPRRCGPGTSWSPTARTRGSGGRSAPPATARIPWAWRCAATSRARSTTSRGSRAISTSATATATTCPGYGWIFPVGDGTVNVGVGLLSTFRAGRTSTPAHLMDAFCATAPARWGISPETTCGPPTGGKLPTGGSVTPTVGPTWLVGRRRRRLGQPVQR